MKKHFIYKYTFDNGKCYIGQSREGVKRYGKTCTYRNQLVGRAMKKYPNYKKEILCYCCEYLVDYLESYYISKYDSNNPEKGYNCESGGNENKHLSDDTKRKISEGNKGKLKSPLSENHKRKISESVSGVNHSQAKTVLQFSKDMIFIREWDYIKQAADELNIDNSAITKCCKEKKKSAGGYVWKYKEVS